MNKERLEYLAMDEEKLELFWIHCLEQNCPLPKKKLNSLKIIASKGIKSFNFPIKFIQLTTIAAELLHYISSSKSLKKICFNSEDVQVYLAWKIWQYKSKNIDKLIINKIARTKAKLVFSKSLVEFHKSASRIKKNAQMFRDTFNTLDLENPQLLETCQSILDSVSNHEQIALKTYQKILENHQEAVKGISSLVNQEIKLLHGV